MRMSLQPPQVEISIMLSPCNGICWQIMSAMLYLHVCLRGYIAEHETLSQKHGVTAIADQTVRHAWYAGASWARALPQLALLAAVVTASTLAVQAAQKAAGNDAPGVQDASVGATARQRDEEATEGTVSTLQASDAGTARQADTGAAEASGSEAVTSVLSRLWQSTKRILQPVPANDGLRSGNEQASKAQSAEQGVHQPTLPDVSIRQRESATQQEAKQESVGHGVQPTSNLDRDEWGRLVLQVDAATNSRNGTGMDSNYGVDKSSNVVHPPVQFQHAREDAESASTILWVRQEPVEQQDGTENDALYNKLYEQDEAKHADEQKHNVPRIRLRHRRFRGREISREALLDNVE